MTRCPFSKSTIILFFVAHLNRIRHALATVEDNTYIDESRVPHVKVNRRVRRRQLATYTNAEDALKEQQTFLLDPKTINVKGSSHSGKFDSPPAGGVIVLGMHRSGTSMLTGLMSKGFGYDLGHSRLYGPQPGENSKGFFERVDIVQQNDIFMRNQNVTWKQGTLKYNMDATAHPVDESFRLLNNKGRDGLEFMTGSPTASETPWIQKDPRMCITLKNWIGMIRKEQATSSDASLPAILFTYRHPLEVARSLYRREYERDGDLQFTLAHGLRLWITYNMRAIQNSLSEGLCMVHTSNDKVLEHGQMELQRISEELTNKCHVTRPPKPHIAQVVVDDFISPELQHATSTKEKTSRNGEECKRNIMWHDQLLLQDESASVLNEGSGLLLQGHEQRQHGIRRRRRTLDVVASDNSPKDRLPYQEYEKDMYVKAMTLFCDMESGAAFEPSYAPMWPEL